VSVESSGQQKIVDGVVAKMTLAGFHNVHGRERLTADWKQFLSHFMYGSLVDGWTVSRRATREEHLTNRETLATHTIVIRGYYSANNTTNSEMAFQNLVDTLGNLIGEDFNLSGYCEKHGPLQVNTVEYRVFGSVLCHYAECSFEADEIVVRSFT